MLDVIPLEITDFLSVFASFQSLKCLVLALGPGLSFTQKRKGLSLPNPDAFSGLCSLGLHSFSTPFVLQLLKAIHASRLQIVNIYLASRVKPDELGELFGSVTSLSGSQHSVRLISLAANGYTSALHSIGDLLSIQHLRHLTLQNTGLVLDDRKLDEMARAWPILQHLSITNDIPPSTTVNGTLKSLNSFSQHCPYIETLELRLNAREVPPLATPPMSIRSGQGVKPLVLRIDLRSDIRDSTGVASFLLGTFPGISVELSGGSQMSDLRETSPWNRVAEIIDETLGRPPPEPVSPKGPRIMCMSCPDMQPSRWLSFFSSHDLNYLIFSNAESRYPFVLPRLFVANQVFRVKITEICITDPSLVDVHYDCVCVVSISVTKSLKRSFALEARVTPVIVHKTSGSDFTYMYDHDIHCHFRSVID